ncbi:hypothetical protein COO60DRAFT_1102264 [Scenedesmus sp. NREL 46B-D3]|nr:hypothetical protein COO60DRAFT_1102264 [Scenedesmus sp. NREL 46B-D3]
MNHQLASDMEGLDAWLADAQFTAPAGEQGHPQLPLLEDNGDFDLLELLEDGDPFFGSAFNGLSFHGALAGLARVPAGQQQALAGQQQGSGSAQQVHHASTAAAAAAASAALDHQGQLQQGVPAAAPPAGMTSAMTAPGDAVDAHRHQQRQAQALTQQQHHVSTSSSSSSSSSSSTTSSSSTSCRCGTRPAYIACPACCCQPLRAPAGCSTAAAAAGGSAAAARQRFRV